jgi:hypothetical protein
MQGEVSIQSPIEISFETPGCCALVWTPAANQSNARSSGYPVGHSSASDICILHLLELNCELGSPLINK